MRLDTVWLSFTLMIYTYLNICVVRMLPAVLNKSWKQNSTQQQFYSSLPPILHAFQVKWTKYARHCWRKIVEIISTVRSLTPAYGHASVDRLTYISTVQTRDAVYKTGRERRMTGMDGKKVSGNFVFSAWLMISIYIYIYVSRPWVIRLPSLFILTK